MAEQLVIEEQQGARVLPELNEAQVAQRWEGLIEQLKDETVATAEAIEAGVQIPKQQARTDGRLRGK